MKLGLCLNVDTSKDQPLNIEILRKIRSLGYSFVELPLVTLTALSDEQLDNMVAVLEEEKLPCEVCNILLPGTIRLTGTEVSEEAIRTYLQDAFRVVRRINVPVVVFGSSGARNVPEGFGHDAAFDQLVNFLLIADEYAKEAGCTIAIEPLNKLESNIVQTIAEGHRLVKAVDRENVKLLVDYYHFGRENDSYDDLAEAFDSIVHVHLANVEKRSFPITLDEGYQRFLNLLVDRGYTGRYSIETSGKPEEDDYRLAYEALQQGLEQATLTGETA